MFSRGHGPSQTDPNADLARQYDGIERMPLLAHAEFITLAPSTDPNQPVDVTIAWGLDRVEKPLPGSALWRTVLENRLARQITPDPAERLIRHQILRSLDRYPDLVSWWAWVQNGWTAPPKPTPRPDQRRSLRSLLRRFRRR